MNDKVATLPQPAKAGDGKPVVQVTASCKECAFWRESPAGPVPTIGAPKRGICFALPPTPAVRFKDGQISGQTNLRPATLETEFCMAFFQPLALSE